MCIGGRAQLRRAAEGRALLDDRAHDLERRAQDARRAPRAPAPASPLGRGDAALDPGRGAADDEGEQARRRRRAGRGRRRTAPARRRRRAARASARAGAQPALRSVHRDDRLVAQRRRGAGPGAACGGARGAPLRPRWRRRRRVEALAVDLPAGRRRASMRSTRCAEPDRRAGALEPARAPARAAARPGRARQQQVGRAAAGERARRAARAGRPRRWPASAGVLSAATHSGSISSRRTAARQARGEVGDGRRRARSESRRGASASAARSSASLSRQRQPRRREHGARRTRAAARRRGSRRPRPSASTQRQRQAQRSASSSVDADVAHQAQRLAVGADAGCAGRCRAPSPCRRRRRARGRRAAAPSRTA